MEKVLWKEWGLKTSQSKFAFTSAITPVPFGRKEEDKIEYESNITFLGHLSHS